MSILRLAVPGPLRQLFDYLPPPDTSEEVLSALTPGQRVQVPFGRRELTAYLVEVAAHSHLPAGELRQAAAILDSRPLLPATLVQLCEWAARYYHHPAGEVFNAAFPQALRAGKPHRPSGEAGWRLTRRGRGLPRGALARSPRQAEALAMLQAAASLPASLVKERGIGSAVLRSLEKKQLVERCQVPPPPRTGTSRGGPQPNREQAAVIAALLAAPPGFGCHLLEGVTGSGKTEVYLRVIEHCLQAGRQALVLIPEIGLTPQTLARFTRRFDADIAVLHSGLGDAERLRAWERARDGSAQIVIGTRSAAFTPLHKPGLIIVDEEHDASYKQQDGFRYSARDVAVKRGQLEACPVLLGSATPSLESIHNALVGRYQLHRLQQRAGGAALPTMATLDVRRQELVAGLSRALLDAIEHALRANQQVLLFLNRRGYAPTLQCHDCGWVAQCTSCDARMTVHRRQRRLRCHHCGASRQLPESCPQCHSRHLLTAGLGTEQAEEVLRERFSQWPVHRVDSDSMQGRQAMSELVDEVNRGEPAILLGTQMLTKGHHFPAVGLVAVIDADAMLFSADFRGEERMAQLLTQVAGRAGRAGTPGRVILQTHYPDHPAIQAMLVADYAEQARGMLARRQATGMPPFGYLLVLRSDCRDSREGENFLQALRERAAPELPGGISLIGPLPSPLQRRAGMFRFQLLALASERATLQAGAAVLVASAAGMRARRDLKWTIDIDPQDLF
ncbi:MAG: primosomal protein N' [Pseudomonadales bacterium]|nr:primosomal protein N' [Pseudomonadales bacterium]